MPATLVADYKSIRYMRVANMDDARLQARRGWLLRNRAYLATAEDVTKSDLRKRARELHAVEAELVRRGLLDRSDAAFAGDPVFVPENDWYDARRGSGVGAET